MIQRSGSLTLCSTASPCVRLELDGLLAHLEMGRLAGPQLRQMIEKGAVEIHVGGAVAVERAIHKGVFGQIRAGVNAGATGETLQPQQLVPRGNDRVQQAPQVGPVEAGFHRVPQTEQQIAEDQRLGDLAGENGGNGDIGLPVLNQFRGSHEDQHEAGLSVDEAGLAVAGDEVHGKVRLPGFLLSSENRIIYGQGLAGALVHVPPLTSGLTHKF